MLTNLILMAVIIAMLPAAALGGILFALVGRPVKEVGTNRINRLKVVWLAARSPELFLKGFPTMAIDIKQSSFWQTMSGRIQNYEAHVREGRELAAAVKDAQAL